MITLGVVWDYFAGTLGEVKSHYKVLQGHSAGIYRIIWGYSGVTFGIPRGSLWVALRLLSGKPGITIRVLWYHIRGKYGTTFGIHWCCFEGSLKVFELYLGVTFRIPVDDFGITVKVLWGKSL